MKKVRLFLKLHPKVTKIILLFYIVFAGFGMFPFRNDMFPFEFTDLILILFNYGFIGLAVAKVYGENKRLFVYVMSLILTGLGMICRYSLEYGEVSNSMNFTPFNILSYLVVIPILILIIYHFNNKIIKLIFSE